ncbi:MAG: hypothetical protein RLN82_05800, partial [Pseudomonadales bacterium]
MKNLHAEAQEIANTYFPNADQKANNKDLVKRIINFADNADSSVSIEEIQSIKTGHQQELEEIKSQHAEDLKTLKEEHGENVTKLREDNKAALQVKQDA